MDRLPGCVHMSQDPDNKQLIYFYFENEKVQADSIAFFNRVLAHNTFSSDQLGIRVGKDTQKHAEISQTDTDVCESLANKLEKQIRQLRTANSKENQDEPIRNMLARLNEVAREQRAPVSRPHGTQLKTVHLPQDALIPAPCSQFSSSCLVIKKVFC